MNTKVGQTISAQDFNKQYPVGTTLSAKDFTNRYGGQQSQPQQGAIQGPANSFIDNTLGKIPGDWKSVV